MPQLTVYLQDCAYARTPEGSTAFSVALTRVDAECEAFQQWVTRIADLMERLTARW